MRCRTIFAGLRFPFFFGTALLAVVILIPGIVAAPSGRLQLVMIEDEACRYCALWHQEIGSSYASTDEGRRAPLVRLDIKSDAARRFERVVYTPTFILVRTDGWEIGRIIGYAGADHFWGELGKLLAKAGAADPQAPFSLTPTGYPGGSSAR